MRNPLNFFVDLARQPARIPAWVAALMTINLASLAFWHEALAKLIFAAFLLSAFLMMGLYARFGFEKILGLGHVLWVPLLAYVLVTLPAASGGFAAFLILWSAATAVSLVLDGVDVWAYLTKRGGSEAVGSAGSRRRGGGTSKPHEPRERRPGEFTAENEPKGW